MAHLPVATRAAGIKQKLDYAETQFNELNAALFGSYEAGELPVFVSQKAENILSNARECFDHLAQDIVEGHVLPHANPGLIREHASGKLKTYFPFYSGQLSRSPWKELKNINMALFDELSNLVDAFDKGHAISNTRFRTTDFRGVQEMVNKKKHSKVIAYEAVPGAAVFHKGPLGTVVITKAMASVPGLRVGREFGGDTPLIVPRFKFTANGLPVFEFCMFAVFGTRTLMDWFYQSFFIGVPERINGDSTMTVDGITVERPMWSYVALAPNDGLYT